jgi:hypothetical protein
VRAALPVSNLSLVLNVLLLLVLLWFQRRTLQRYFNHWWVTWSERHPRRWKSQSAHDWPHCQVGLSLQFVRSKRDLLPYSQRKSRRGRKKTIPTRGFACPIPACDH